MVSQHPWGKIAEECTSKPSIELEHNGLARAWHEDLGEYQFAYEGNATPFFTENETNALRPYRQAVATISLAAKPRRFYAA